ncbi:MAG: 30S ribosome-binding factor RbfA [Spirochaetaceae bacterium]|jgi:ribosome-binding factor A|nr:30S ribosome-binding factor RbfA [Spirochaetaceae bacterium]
MAGFRTDRVGILIQEKIGELIVGGKIKDPRVDSFLSITRVEVSRDLAYADVFVSSYKAGLSKGVAGLKSAAGFIQAQLAHSMRIRATPRLRFHEDPGIREGFEIIQKIENLTEDHDSRLYSAE